jgi:hypothetical protein
LVWKSQYARMAAATSKRPKIWLRR